MLTSTAEIPNRALFKAAEVCEIAQLQPYVLRSWEAEFPNLGVARGAAAARMYRRADVERVLRIKQLLFVEGLTLAGIRRRMEDETGPVVAEDVPLDELLGRNARERLADVKRGLQGILDLLSNTGSPQTPSVLQSTDATHAARVSRSDGKRVSTAPKKASRVKVALKSQKATRRKRH